MAGKSLAHLSGQVKPKEAQNIKNDKASQNFVDKASSQKNTAKGDAAKWQHAVQLAREDFGENADTDDRKFLERAESYYATMNPESTADQVRGKNAFTSAVEDVAHGIDGVNDFLGDGVKGAWDLLAGGGAEALGGLAGMLTGDKDTASDWRNFTEGVIDDKTADALASIGTSLAVSAIPGFGVPASIALAGLQNADNINEALTGRDSVTLQQLDDNERTGRAINAALDLGMSALPGIGKLDEGIDAARAAGKIAPLADDASEAAKILDKVNPVNQAKVLANDIDRMKSGFNAAKESAINSAAAEQYLATDFAAKYAPGTGYHNPIDQLIDTAKTRGSVIKQYADDALDAYRGARYTQPVAKEAGEKAAKGAAKGAAKEAGEKAAKGAAKGAAKEAGEKTVAGKEKSLGKAALNVAKKAGGSRAGQLVTNPLMTLAVNAASGVPIAMEAGLSGNPEATAGAIQPRDLQTAIRNIILTLAPGSKKMSKSLGLNPNIARFATSNKAFRDAKHQGPAYDEMNTEDLSKRMDDYYEED